MTATPTKWQLKREASHAVLVGSAMRCFHERGYAATRVEDIVAGTGYTAGAFYFHFENKTDCFWDVIAYRERLRGDWASEITAGLEPATASLETVLARVFARFAEAEQGLGAWVLVLVDFHQQHRGDPEAEVRLAEFYETSRATIARFVAALQAGGWVDPDRDTALLARQIFAITEGLIVHDRLYVRDEAAFQAAVFDGLVRLLAGRPAQLG